jgi:hypothetical protein
MVPAGEVALEAAQTDPHYITADTRPVQLRECSRPSTLTPGPEGPAFVMGQASLPTGNESPRLVAEPAWIVDEHNVNEEEVA